MKVKKVAIGGVLSASCKTVTGLFSKGTCQAGLGYANRTIAKLKPDIATKLKDAVNDTKTQNDLANAFKPYLTIGEAGEINVLDVRTDSKTVIISFDYAAKAGG